MAVERTQGLRGARSIPRCFGRTPRRHEQTGPGRPSSSGRPANDPAFERLEAPCYLEGHFQLPQYFEPGLDQVRTRLIDHLQVGARWAATDARDALVVGVHFRRGDFVALGWALGLDYYDRALAAVQERSPDVCVRVFSDDRVFATLVEEHLVGRGFAMAPAEPDLAAHGPGRGEPTIAALVTMARCDHLVMDNSTFSWWAAAVGDQLDGSAGRLVVCPEAWHPNRPSNALRRPEWLAIDSHDFDPGGHVRS